jgi:NADH:ubiquinone oxidoreductase subunit E
MSESAPVQAPPPDLALLDPVIARHRGGGQAALLPVLREAQAIYGYLPRPVVEVVSEELRVPVSNIYGVISFYDQFRVHGLARHRIKLCRGTSCTLAGAHTVRQAVQRSLGLSPGERSADGRFLVEETFCLGHCSDAPNALIDGECFDRLTPQRATKLLERLKSE